MLQCGAPGQVVALLAVSATSTASRAQHLLRRRFQAGVVATSVTASAPLRVDFRADFGAYPRFFAQLQTSSSDGLAPALQLRTLRPRLHAGPAAGCSQVCPQRTRTSRSSTSTSPFVKQVLTCLSCADNLIPHLTAAAAAAVALGSGRVSHREVPACHGWWPGAALRPFWRPFALRLACVMSVLVKKY
jgi:hypothetical protein